jgi:phage terminase large subunit GpA-like protein
MLGVAEGKDTLFASLAAQDGRLSLHFPMHFDFEYFRMLCAEHPVREKDRRTGKMVSVWKLRDGYTRNEALDIRVGNMAIREILNPNYEVLTEYLRAEARAIKAGVPTVTGPPKRKIYSKGVRHSE